MAASNPDDLEELQRLSDKYQPQLEGPLIGGKLPITALVVEYAEADPTYVAKTQALVHSHDHYRRVKGDGQCGWRGVVFRYFEIIAESKDHDLAQQEEIRIKSFEDTMKMAGVEYDLLVDFFDETWALFHDIRTAFQNNLLADSIVVAAFNDENRSNAIVYHFKMMTSSYMALRPDDFEPFLEMPLDQYRQSRIDPTNQEIDQIGLQALSTGVIAPAGLAVEVLYLDRSAGDVVTPHEFTPGGTSKPTIRLLYRPGHYDLIYKHEPFVLRMNMPGQAQQGYQHLEDGHVDDRLYEYMFPAAHLDPNSDPNYQYDQSPSHYNYQSQTQFPPAHVFDPSSMYCGPPYSMPPTQPANYPHSDYTTPGHTPAYYHSSPENYQPSPPPAVTPTSPVPGNVFPPSNLPVIRHSGFSSAIRGPGRVQHVNIPLDPRSFGNFTQEKSHFTHSDFAPAMWDPKNTSKK